MSSPEWEAIVYKIYEEHKDWIEQAITEGLNTWREGNYFGSGQFKGKLESLYLLPNPKEEKELEKFMLMVPF